MARKKKIDKEIGFRLKQARTDQKLTYEELAENPAFLHDISKRLKIMEIYQALKS